MCLSRFLLTLILLLQSSLLFSADKNTKIVLHVNDGFKLGHLQKSVANIRNELGESVVIKVVVNGKAVTRLLKSNEESAKIVESVLERNASIGLCHNAVSNNQVSKDMLIEGLEVLETDGNVTIIKYQKQGFIYIKL